MEPAADHVVTLSGIFRAAGPVALLAVFALIAIFALVARGVRSRLRGTGTAAVQWWLGRVVWTLVLAGVLAYTLRLAGVHSEVVVAVNDGRTKGVVDHLVFGAYQGLAALLVPLAVALFGVLASMIVGAPRAPAD